LLPNPELLAEPASILVVEDEKIVAKDIEKSLRRMGYDVAGTAASAEEALRCAARRCPDLVLMDIRIKGERDGIETAKVLRRRFDVPVIYLSAYADDETVGRARATEPYGYIVKPFKAAELRSAIEIALFKHQMEARLRERERWFSTTLAAIGDAVIAVDRVGDVTFMNLAAELLIGMRLQDAAGRKLVDLVRLVDERTRAPVENSIGRAMSEGKVVGPPTGTRLVCAEGDRPVEDSAAPIIDDRGNLLGTVMVFRDVSEQRRMQQQIALADRLASLGTLAAGVAHEINNPLAVIVGNAAFLDQRLAALEASADRWIGSEENRASFRQVVGGMEQALGDLREGANRTSRIVADLRTFGRPHDDPNEATDVGPCVEWALRVAANQVSPRARLVTQLRPVPAVRGSGTRLGQVIVNLLVNAVQAIEEGHPADNEIVVSTELDEGGRVVVEVRDTGRGIAPTDLVHVFDPFFTTKTIQEGSGLGLSICHGIVKALGGEITVESLRGRGSTFRVLLPQARAGEQRTPAEQESSSQRRRGRILVVDDEPMVLRALQRTLESDHEVTAMSSAAEALCLLAQDPNFDLILCDLMMPDATGMDLYESLLARSELAQRVVFLTGGAFTPRAADFLAAVPNLHLDKPFSPSDLLAFVQRFLRDQGRGKPMT
jgi:PAS domain S-box-containing protein